MKAVVVLRHGNERWQGSEGTSAVSGDSGSRCKTDRNRLSPGRTSKIFRGGNCTYSSSAKCSVFCGWCYIYMCKQAGSCPIHACRRESRRTQAHSRYLLRPRTATGDPKSCSAVRASGVKGGCDSDLPSKTGSPSVQNEKFP